MPKTSQTFEIAFSFIVNKVSEKYYSCFTVNIPTPRQLKVLFVGSTRCAIVFAHMTAFKMAQEM